VKIDIPSILLHLRGKAVEAKGASIERTTMRRLAWVFGRSRRYTLGQRLARLSQFPFVRAGQLRRLPPPLSAWRINGDAIADAIGATCAARGATRLVIPADLPTEWRPAGLELVVDNSSGSPRELDAFHGVVTGCTLAIAETGTIVLTAGPGEGQRALTLVPDLHICVVQESQIVELIPEAFIQLAPLVREERRPVTFISGPSATSDIELSRVEGVHGPRILVVLIVSSLRAG
jgi:L-lactate dehydrogenase complex protein LldG